MNRTVFYAAAFAVITLLGLVSTDDANAQGLGQQFGKGAALHQFGPIDEDGDGIPNCLDPDYVKPKDGTGNQFGKGNGKAGEGKRHGPGDGTGNKGIGPRDGTGFGPGGGEVAGSCDGTGPKGKIARRGRR